MKHWLLFYDYVPDYLERRGEFRPDHFAHAQAFHDRGELVMAGAFAEPADGAVLVFRAESAEVAERFAGDDPYVRNGLVTGWRVRRWVMVMGDGAEPV
ncbi:MAG TPA: YciI-like protein [Acidimicrobiales bacterium]|nr:YciI-like protein [Acidimicrobiales bacterium]